MRKESNLNHRNTLNSMILSDIPAYFHVLLSKVKTLIERVVYFCRFFRKDVSTLKLDFFGFNVVFF